MKFIKSFLFFTLTLFSISAFADIKLVSFSREDQLTNLIKLLDHQDKVVEWVKNNTTNKASTDNASDIVFHTFNTSISTGIDPTIILAIMRTESGFRTNAKSGYGAKGLMQVVPRFHKDKLKGESPFNIQTSIRVGTQVLTDCLRKHKGSTYKALNCYSGGGGSKYYRTVSGFKSNLDNFLKSKIRSMT